AGERHPVGEGGGVGGPHHPLHGVQIAAQVGSGTTDLVDGGGAGHAPALVCLLGRGRGDIVGDVDDPGVDTLGEQPLPGGGEVQPVPGVVAERQHQPGPAGGGPPHPVDLLGGGGGEDVTQHAPVGEPWPDDPGVGGVVAGAATHHQAHLAGPGAVLADEPGGVRYPSHVPGVGGGEAVDDVCFEV